MQNTTVKHDCDVDNASDDFLPDSRFLGKQDTSLASRTPPS